MGKFELWMAKHLHNRIERYKKYRDKLNLSIKRDMRLRQEYLNKLELNEYYMFGMDTGYISKDKKER